MSSETVLVTGALGYIGQATCKLLKENGYTVKAVDHSPIHNRHRKYIDHFKHVNFGSDSLWYNFMSDVEYVIHLAASISVDESYKHPDMYYDNNVLQLSSFLRNAKRYGPQIRNIVFASSAAIFADSDKPLTPYSTIEPYSPYARTKVIGEYLLTDSGIPHIMLRYFNVAGAHEDIGPSMHSGHLMNVAARCAVARKPITVNGYSSPTISLQDGTCERDYVHVMDVARANILAVQSSFRHERFNIGTGRRTSNLQLVNMFHGIPSIEKGPYRSGDTNRLVADYQETNKLAWKPQYNLDDIVKSTYDWYKERSIT